MHRSMRTSIIVAVAACTALSGCGPDVRTRTTHWRTGAMQARQSYYLSSEGHRVLHGVSTYWDEQGAVFAEGTWQRGKPIEGVCWIAAVGDAGSWGGLGHFARYKEGKLIARVPTPSWFTAPQFPLIEW